MPDQPVGAADAGKAAAVELPELELTVLPAEPRPEPVTDHPVFSPPTLRRRRSHHFCVVPAGSPKAQQVQAVTLDYPSHWSPPAMYNNHSLYAETSCEMALQWLSDKGLVPSPTDENYKYWKTRVDAMNVKSYGGCSLPLGNFAFSLLNTKMTLIWLVWDDMVVEVSPQTPADVADQEQHFINISEIMHGKWIHKMISFQSIFTKYDRFEVAWNEIVREISHQKSLSEDYFRRFGDSFTQWCRFARAERDELLFSSLVESLNGAPPESSSTLSRVRSMATKFEAMTSANNSPVHRPSVSKLSAGSPPKTSPESPQTSKQQAQAHTLNQPTTSTAYYFDAFTMGLVPNASPKTVDYFNLYVEQRKKTIGMVNTAQFLEVVCGFELPKSILAHDYFKKIIDDAALLVGLTNELLSVAKDIKHFESQPGSEPSSPFSAPPHLWTNLVLIYSTLFDQSLQQAILSVVAMHNEAVLRFDQHAGALLRLAQQDAEGIPRGWTERLSAYLCTLRLCIRGFAFWHVSTPRYTSLWPVDTEARTAFSFQLAK